jgi:hypothetical protein
MLGFLVSWLIGVRTYLLIPRWETNQLGFHKWCLTPIYSHQCGNAGYQFERREGDLVDLCAALVVGVAARFAVLFGAAVDQLAARFVILLAELLAETIP